MRRWREDDLPKVPTQMEVGEGWSVSVEPTTISRQRATRPSEMMRDMVHGQPPMPMTRESRTQWRLVVYRTERGKGMGRNIGHVSLTPGGMLSVGSIIGNDFPDLARRLLRIKG